MKHDYIKILEGLKTEIRNDVSELIATPAINPRIVGGTGEDKAADWICSRLGNFGIPYERVEIPDYDSSSGKRPNIVVRFAGQGYTGKTLWFVAHLDTVGVGERVKWESDPFVPRFDGQDIIYGLGSEDNGQAVISLLYCCRLIKELGILTENDIGFVFVADEETGSDYGLKALVKKGTFHPGDEAVVPDGGSPDGSFIEIAEKNIAWIKFTVTGKTAHASWPYLGVNATSVGMHLGCDLETDLRKRFCARNTLFDPPYSTFELTQKFANVDSPNVIPGKDQFVMDMRILPCYTITEMLELVEATIARYEYEYKVRIEYEFLQRVDAPPPTDTDARIVKVLENVLRKEGVTAYSGGIGGGTCAAILRREGIPAVVWSHLNDVCHIPNEYVDLKNIIKDVNVYLRIMDEY